MQIHELTQPKKTTLDEAGIFSTVGDAITSGGATLMTTAGGRQARRDAEQGRINTQAARAVAKLEKNLPKAEPVPTLDQALTKLKANPAAQQWINSVVAKWPAAAQQLSQYTRTPQNIKEGPLSDRARQRSLTNKTTTTPTTTTTTPNPFASTVNNLSTSTNTGLKPDPTTNSSTGGATTTSATGQTHVASSANPNMYPDQFRKWVNSQLKTTSLEKLETDAEVKSKLEPLLTQIVAAKDTPKQQELVRDFFTLAVAANHVVQAKQKDPLDPAYQGRAGSRSNLGQSMDDTQEPVDTGLSTTNLYFLNQAVHKAGGPAPTKSTGNKWMDNLVQQIWNGR